MGCADMFHFPDSGVTICYATNLASWTVTPPREAYEGLWDEVTEAVFNLRYQAALDKDPEEKPHSKDIKK